MSSRRIDSPLETFPLWTPELQGCGGRLGPRPEDFIVEEIPAYGPSGSGEHTLALIEKRGLTTLDAVHDLAKALEIHPKNVGYAGMKDRHAVCRQALTFLGVEPQRLLQLELDGIQILEAAPHKNKLRAGHLLGNRFTLQIHGAGQEGLERAKQVSQSLEARGVYNIFGPQRFGRFGDNATKARALLESGRAPRTRRHRLLISALQSELFNHYVEKRLAARALEKVLEGDIMRRGRSYFPVEDLDSERRRHASGELSLTGPIFGPRTPRPPDGTAPRAWEKEVLAEAGLSLEDLATFKRAGRGGRRDLLVSPSPLKVTRASASPENLTLEFSLPPGAYATVVAREVLKVPFSRLRPEVDDGDAH